MCTGNVGRKPVNDDDYISVANSSYYVDFYNDMRSKLRLSVTEESLAPTAKEPAKEAVTTPKSRFEALAEELE